MEDIIAVGPDGTQHVFPAGTSQEVIDRVMRQNYGPAGRQARAQAAAALNPEPETPTRRRSLWERFDDRLQNSLQESAMFGGLARSMVSRGIEGEYTVRDPETGQVIERRRDDNDAIRQGLRDNEVARRQDLATRTEGDEWYSRGAVSPLAGAATLGGELFGAALDPTSWIGWGRSLVVRAGSQASLNAGSDGLAQASDLSTGVQEKWDYGRSALAAALGGGLSIVADGVRPTARWFTDTFLRKPEADVRVDLEVGDRLNVPALTTAEIAPTPARPDGADDAVRVVKHPETGQEITLRGSGTPVDQVAGGIQPGDYVENGMIWRAGQQAPQSPADAPQAPSGTTTPEPVSSPRSESAGASTPPSQALALPEAEPRADAGGPTGFDAVDWGARRSPERAAAAVRHLDGLRKWIKPEAVDAFVRTLDEGIPGATEGVHINERWVDWEKMGSDPESILGLTNAMADIFQDVYSKAGDARQGWEQTAKIASQMGFTLSDVIKTHADITGEGGITARAGALRDAALASDKAAATQLKAVRAAMAKGDMTGLKGLVDTLHRTVIMDAMDAGASSEIARALQYRRRLGKPAVPRNDLQTAVDEINSILNKGGDLDEVGIKKVVEKLDEAYERGGSAGLRQSIRQMREMGFWDYVNYYATASLLSAPVTHLRNAVGTPIHAVFQIGERYVAAGVGFARTSIGLGSRERVTFREALAYSSGIMQAWSEGLSLGAQAFARGAPVTELRSSVMSEQTAAQVPFAFTPTRFNEWKAKPMSPRTWADMVGVGVFELQRTLGFRPSVATDELYKALGRKMQLNALSYREAAYRAALADPKDADKVFQQTLAALQDQPTDAAFREARSYFDSSGQSPDAVFAPGSREEEMALILRSIDHRQMAVDHAQLLTFQTSGPIVEKFDQALRSVPIIKTLWVNFVRTPVAILRAGIVDRNPVVTSAVTLGELTTPGGRQKHRALFEALASEEQALARGGAEADLAIARQAMGAAVLTSLWMFWANGNIVGKQTEQERQNGVQDYSFRLPNGEWVQYTGMSPLGEMIGLVADTANGLRNLDASDNVMAASVGAVAAAIRHNIVNKSFLKGLTDFMEMMTGGQYGASANAEDAAKQIGKSLTEAVAPRIVPGGALLRRIAQNTDPVVRDARSFNEMLFAGLPTLSETIAARRDFLGRPIVRPEGQRGPFQAFNTSRPSVDPLERELGRLASILGEGFRIGMPPRTLNGEELTAAEYSRLVEVQGQVYRIRGQTMEENLRGLIADPDYQSADPEAQAYQVKRVVERYREGANRAVRNPTSDVYMGEAARRTGAIRLERETRRRGWSESQALNRARDYGLQPDDPEVEKLRSALFGPQ